MTHNFLKNGIQKIREIRISPEEKTAMLARLMERIETQAPPTVSPLSTFFVYSRTLVSHVRFSYAIAVVLIVALAGGSSAFAAEGALPGDLLYPVKVSVVEPLRSAITVSTSAKAELEAEKAVRRLQEAEALASENRLDATSTQMLKESFEKSAERFNVLVESKKERPSPSLINAQVNFEASIGAHSRILSAVENAGTSTPSQKDLAPLRNALEKNIREVKNHKGPTEIHKDALEKEQSIQTIISTTHDHLQDTERTLSGVASTSVENVILKDVPETLKKAEKALEEAKRKRESGNPGEAFSSLLDSERSAKEAEITVKESLKFRGNRKNRE
jgi:hypothetical protein